MIKVRGNYIAFLTGGDLCVCVLAIFDGYRFRVTEGKNIYKRCLLNLQFGLKNPVMDGAVLPEIIQTLLPQLFSLFIQCPTVGMPVPQANNSSMAWPA